MSEPEHQFQSQPTGGDLLGDGVRLHYLDWGPADGIPILFLHGGGLTAHTWDVVCDLLHNEHRCIALDLRGHGDSEWSHEGEYGVESHAADLERAVQWLGLDQFVLVGMSLGGITALAYAGRHSETLSGLVLVDIGPSGGRPAGSARIRDFTSGPEEHATVEEFVEKALRFNSLRTPERLRRSLLHNLRRTPQGTWTWKYDRRHRSPYRSDDPDAQRRRDERRELLWKAIKNVQCPTLVVRGAQSDVFLDVDAQETVAALEHGRLVTIEGAGHTVQGDRPYALTDALRRFLTSDVGVPTVHGDRLQD